MGAIAVHPSRRYLAVCASLNAFYGAHACDCLLRPFSVVSSVWSGSYVHVGGPMYLYSPHPKAHNKCPNPTLLAVSTLCAGG